jgi:E3 ubiquitin-protein ligase HECTD1
VCEELGKAAKEAEAALRRQRRILKNNMVRHMLTGARVVRGNDNTFLFSSVADPDPGSCAFFDPRDPGWVKKSRSGSGLNIPDHISENLEIIFWVKNT